MPLNARTGSIIIVFIIGLPSTFSIGAMFRSGDFDAQRHRS